MRIAQVSPLWLEVPPHNYGGTEYIISLLTDELVKQGHEVTLFATSNAETKAELIPLWHKGLFRDANAKEPGAVAGLLTKAVLEQQHRFDIIHDHTASILVPVSDFIEPPILSTIHNPLTEESVMLYKKFPDVHYVAISNDHRRSAPGVPFSKMIYHGIPVENYDFNDKPDNYLLWLSNIQQDKGLAEAIEIAKISGEKLIIAGTIFPKNTDYFEHRIKPLIDGKQIQFVGNADFKKKIDLLKNAKAFLFPIFSRQEPFGLVVIEAMACGTPVIAPPTGAMPELIDHGKTGFLVNSMEEALQAVKKVDKISRQDCRDHIVENFKVQNMVQAYEELYRKITSGNGE